MDLFETAKVISATVRIPTKAAAGVTWSTRDARAQLGSMLSITKKWVVGDMVEEGLDKRSGDEDKCE